MEFGLFVEPQFGGSYDRLLELAQWSEAFGLDAFARSDHYLNGDSSFDTTDALISFGGLARETSSIRLVSLVSPITFRHPSVMAKSATSLDEMSGGRFTLGVGTGLDGVGTHSVRHGPPTLEGTVRTVRRVP